MIFRVPKQTFRHRIWQGKIHSCAEGDGNAFLQLGHNGGGACTGIPSVNSRRRKAVV